MEQKDIIEKQKNVCNKYNSKFVGLDLNLKIGISKNINSGDMPINGLRHKPENGTAGWYIWAGKNYTNEIEFWETMHIYHLLEIYPEIVKYLAIEPGFRFLFDSGEYEDVWFDESLLKTN